MPQVPTLLAAFSLGLCCILPASPTHGAAPSDGKQAVTNVQDADTDYHFQGEYVGVLYEADSGSWVYGLQVVARGDGQFQAVRTLGGLPGAGWDLDTKSVLTGELHGNLLTLLGDGITIESDGQVATAYDTAGRELGKMTKAFRISPTMGSPAPSNAVILFDGVSTNNLVDARVTEDNLLEVGCTTAMPVEDFRLHLEFRIPYMPYASGQGRGNSGVYIQRRYEMQILDSFGLEGKYNECGALYRQQTPDTNMCLPPLSWQTYDIWFTAARFDDEGDKTANARITVLHNGVPIHSNREILTKTGAGRPEGPEPLPILLQNHSNPVNFRNVWLVHLEDEPTAKAVARCPTRRCRLPRIRRLLRRLFCRRCCRLRA